MENLLSYEQLLTLNIDKTNNLANNSDYFLKIKTELINFKKLLKKTHKESYYLLKGSLDKAIEQIDKTAQPAIKQKDKQIASINVISSIFFCIHLYLINYEKFEVEITNKQLNKIKTAKLALEKFRENITKIICYPIPDSLLDEDSFLKANLAKLNFEKYKSIHSNNTNINEQKFINSYSRAATIFTIKFAQILTKKNLKIFYIPAIKNIANHLDENVAGFINRFLDGLKLAPHKLIKTVNETVTDLQKLFLPAEASNNIIYNDITKKKVSDKFKTILSETSITLKNFNYNWLEKFFLSSGGDSSSSPDKFARTLGVDLTKENYTTADNNPNYLKIIKDINTLFERISAFNFSIKKTCLTAIERLLKLILADSVDISLLVEIFPFIPKQTPHVPNLYRKICKNFGSLCNKNKIAFLNSIAQNEINSDTTDSNFKKFALQINCEALDLDELADFIKAIETHNHFLKTKLNSFSGLFIAKEEITGNKISKETLTKLDHIKRQREAEKVFKAQNEQLEHAIEINSKKTAETIIAEQNNTIEQTENNLVNRFASTFDIQNHNEIATILASNDGLDEKEEKLKTLFQLAKPEGDTLSEEELTQIRQLLVAHQKTQEEKNALIANTQNSVQQQFYALLLNKLDSTLAAMRTLSTGYFQTYDNQATGMASAAFSALGTFIPLIGGAFKGISAVLDWANQKRLMTEAKELASVALTSTDDTILARKFSLKITELLNEHPVKDYKLTNIDIKSIANLVEHVVRKLVLILVKENTNDYQTKINSDFDSFINRCLEQLTATVPSSILNTNTNIENFFQARITLTSDKEIEAEQLLKKAKQEIRNPESLKTQSQEQSQLRRETSLLKLVKQNADDINALKKKKDKKKEKEKILKSSDQPTSEEIVSLKTRIDDLDKKNKMLEKRLAETEKSLQRITQLAETQPANTYFQNTATTSSSLSLAADFSELQTMLFMSATKHALPALLMAKNSISLPPRGDSQYEEGEILGNFIYVADKPGGIEPGFLCFLMDDEFKKETLAIIQSNKNKKPYKNLIKKDIQDIDVYPFIKNRDCCLDILDKLKKDKMLPFWLIKQDYRDPKPGEDTVTIDSRDFRKTNTFKVANGFIDNEIATKVAQTVRRRSILEENTNAILENLGTTVASLFTKVHSQYLLKGKYKSGRTKFMTVSQWNHTFKDYKNKLRAGYLIKLDQRDKPTKVTLLKRTAENTSYFIAENKVKNLGAAKIFALLSKDRDAIGSTGMNKGEDNNEFFGIDFGHTFREPHTFIDKLKDDGSIKLPTEFKNFSIFEDIPLSELMKGVLILAKLRGSPLDKELVESYGLEFAAKLEKIKAGDDENVFTEYKKYFQSFINDNDEYSEYLEKIKAAEKYYMDAANSILRTFQKRLFLTAQQIDLLDNLEKLCNKTISIHKQDDEEIILNHLKKKSRDVIWQLDVIKNNQGNVIKMRFYSQSKEAKKMLEEYINKTGNQITLRISKTSDSKSIQFEIEPQYFEKVFQAFSEEKIADYKNQPLASAVLRQFLSKPNISRNTLFPRRVMPKIIDDGDDIGADTGLSYQQPVTAPIAVFT